MLTHLLIKNYALIQHLEITPDSGLNIITGETGAGKSIMLGAIGLLLGNRADVKTLYDIEEKCVIEGTFNLSNYELQPVFEAEDIDYEPISLIRREITPSGKSRAFINDTPTTLDVLKRIGENLMDVHSQHDTSTLGSIEYQLQIIDTFAQNVVEVSNYKASFQVYLAKKNLLEKLQDQAKQNKKDFEYNTFLLNELVNAKLKIGEFETLEQQLFVQENAEEILFKLNLANNYLNGEEQSVIPNLEMILASISGIANLSKNYSIIKDRIVTTLIELRDLAGELDSEIENVDFDEKSISDLKFKTNQIIGLFQKHQVKTEVELIQIENDLNAKVGEVLNIDENLAFAQKELDLARKKLSFDAEILSKSRISQLKEIESKVTKLLFDLGMPNAILEINHEIVKPTLLGTDLISFMFTANKGIKPQQLKLVASGGEFSRLMLAIKYLLANKRTLPTIIFDEIDTGVSGEISIKVGKMIHEMAKSHQIVAITHLHQMAAQGNSHFFVYKDNEADKATSRIKLLTKQERINEIAQMIGGNNPSQNIIKNAEEILASYN